MSFTERKRAMLEKRLAELNEEWEAVYAQIGRELNEATKLRLQRQANALEQEIATLEADISQFDEADIPSAINYGSDGTQAGPAKYNITITGGKAVIIGDQNTVTQHFTDEDNISG